jgi:uncharacterized protein
MGTLAMSSKTVSPRLEGLDLARGLALLGMLLVNFRLAMGVPADPGLGWGRAFMALEGRTAAAFVMLAGLGLMLGAQRSRACLRPEQLRAQTWRRAAFLFVLGLLNMLIFPADILHYYGCYFALGALLLGRSFKQLAALALGLPWLFVLALFVWDYERGWDWATLSYADFWQPAGFMRHLLFNGFHPLLPWLAFFLWGMALARLPLHSARTQTKLMFFGLLVFAGCLALREPLRLHLPGWQDLLGIGLGPLPPGPLYVFSAAGLATALIGACLRWSQGFSGSGWRLPALQALGRCTLSVYVAHIVVGMGVLEAVGWLSGRSLSEVLAVGLLFGGCAMLICWVWLQRAKNGPLEAVLRYVSKPARRPRLLGA